MTQIVRTERGISATATVLFLVAYAAIIVLLLAPKDMFWATPGSQVIETE